MVQSYDAEIQTKILYRLNYVSVSTMNHGLPPRRALILHTLDAWRSRLHSIFTEKKDYYVLLWSLNHNPASHRRYPNALQLANPLAAQMLAHRHTHPSRQTRDPLVAVVDDGSSSPDCNNLVPSVPFRQGTLI